MEITEVETVDAFDALGRHLSDVVVQNVDFTDASVDWSAYRFEDVVFLGCTFAECADIGEVIEAGALVFPRLRHIPYVPYRTALYSPAELHAAGPDARSYDQVIYDHFVDKGRHGCDILESLAQRIHDHAIDDALATLVAGRKVVGIMGGHSTSRTDPYFARVARLARGLTRAGYFVTTGGGPGTMEAGNLGAYFAPHDDQALDDALAVLADQPLYTDPGYFERAHEVRERWPDGADSLAVPTWFYGHEPSNLFGSYVAKYFSNSIREDGLLAISLHGIVFAPGSAGTTQEIFQDATQNHYGTFGYYSPMVFLGRRRYKRDTFIFPLLEQLAWGRTYADFLHLTDDPDDAVRFIEAHPPLPVGA